MNPTKHPNPLAVFSIFLLTLMLTAQLLTLGVLWLLELTAPVLMIAGSVMVLADTVILRILRTGKPALLRLRRIIAHTAALLVTGCTAAGCVAAVLISTTVSAMLSPGTIVSTSPVPTPRRPHMEPFAVYLSGIDTRGSALTQSRSDVNIIAAADPVNKQLLLVNTPRDYYVSNPAGGGAKDKLTHCGLYGADNSRQALAELYGVPIAYAAQINFKGFEMLIDALGGVTVYSDTAFTTTEGGYSIRQGENKLDGAGALAFARERSHLSGGDVSRGENQMKLIAALMEQASPANLMANYRSILSSLDGMLTTDMPLSTITKLVTTQLDDLKDWTVRSVSVTGTDGTDYNYSSGGTAYVMYPDGESVRAASQLLQTVLQGDPLPPEEDAS